MEDASPDVIFLCSICSTTNVTVRNGNKICTSKNVHKCLQSLLSYITNVRPVYKIKVYIQVLGDAMDGEAGGVEPRLLGVPTEDSVLSDPRPRGLLIATAFEVWNPSPPARRSTTFAASRGPATCQNITS